MNTTAIIFFASAALIGIALLIRKWRRATMDKEYTWDQLKQGRVNNKFWDEDSEI
jgi:hypothetical protein